MKKYSVLFLSGLTLALFSLSFSACDDDEDPPVKPKLSFSETTLTVNEADGTIEIEVSLDKAATEDITVTYELDGTAVDEVRANSEDIAADYEITSDYLEIEIDKGETTGVIEIELKSDYFYEPTDETIEISIVDVDSDNIEITRDDEMEVIIEQQDGLIIELIWESSSIDMDLLVRKGETIGTWAGVVAGSLYGYPERSFIPSITADGAAFGVSYTYYDGVLADDTLDFAVVFADFSNGTVEAEANMEIFETYYTAVNKNKWESLNSTIVVQTFEKIGGAFTNFSDIEVPEAGSRTISNDNFSAPFKRSQIRSDQSAKLQSLFKKINN